MNEYTRAKIHDAVQHLVHTFETNDPLRLSQLLRLHLLPSHIPAGMWGILIRYDRESFFGYDICVTVDQQRLYLAHEIGHLVLHRDHAPLFLELDECRTSAVETEAEAFAVELLQQPSRRIENSGCVSGI
ncbi:MAG: ImmA/IrrE family metallo-endopeptidase [Acidithiobacillus sp.]|nr:ImmA/IrrE family metallo-endopeptidase [Acidithiobacillus sp.]